MANRKQPFGYKIEQGQIVVNSPEAEIVQMLFTQYNNGASLKEIAQALNEQPVPYEKDKQWNKNMVSRILTDERYIGSKGYIPLVDENIYRCVGEKRLKKQSVIRPTEIQKTLRRLCGQAVTVQIEQRVLETLNGLARDPMQVTNPVTQIHTSDDLRRIESAFEEEMDTPSVDEEAAIALIFQIAAAQYEAINAEEYEAHRLRRIFETNGPMQALDAELIQNTIRKIHTGHGKIEIELRNGQMI